MSIIIRNAGAKRRGEKTQIYTWAACIMVLVFALSIAAAVKGSGKKSDSHEAYRKQAFDLGNMPFSDDSAEAYLLASNKYNDIAKNDLINGLFSKKQKEARQADDAINGVPVAPDAEYKAAAEEQAAKKIRMNRPKPTVKNQTPTRPSGSLSKGSMVTASGGGSGARGTLWTANDKASSSGGSKMQAGQAALIAQVKGGKAMGFQHAAQASARAANAKDLDAAAAGAADAFQKGATEVGKDVLEGELEKDAAGLDIDDESLQDKMDRASNSEDLAGLDAKLEKKKKEKDAETAESCADNPFANWGCAMGQILDIAKTVGGSILGGLF